MKAKGQPTHVAMYLLIVIVALLCVPFTARSEEAPPEVDQEADVIAPDDKGIDRGATAAVANGDDSASTGLVPTVPEINPFTGSLGYKIPIEVPPGRNGIAPNVAITYNSQVRNGLAGIGWTVDFGSIQRDTKYGLNYSANPQDDHVFVASINGGAADLVYSSSWSTTQVPCYQTKVEGAFSKYCWDRNTNIWTVTAKDGTKYTYGQESEGTVYFHARQYDTSGNPDQIFRWYLNKVEDTNGNYMTVTYTRDLNEIWSFTRKA